MKNICFFIVLVLCTNDCITAQFEVSHSSTTISLNDVYFIDQDIGVAVGDSGTIVRSTDGGSNWNVVLSIDSLRFSKVTFLDHLQGLAIGKSIYITADAGVSWSAVELPFDNDYFSDIEILKDSVVVVSGFPNRICKSSNGGVDWQILVGDTLPYEILQMSFVDHLIGYATHWEGSVINSTLKTTDGGNSWTEIEASTGGDITILEDISFVSEDVGFRGGWYNNLLMKTSDSAGSWYETSQTDTTDVNQFWSGIFDFHIVQSQPDAYYACGWYGNVFKSIDGGAHWSQLNSPLSNAIVLNGIFFIDDNTGWAVGQVGTILKITNGGELTAVESENNPSSSLTIYPNPFSEEVFVRGQDQDDIESITLFDQLGKLIKTSTTGWMDTQVLPTGVYVLFVKTKMGSYSQKLVKI